MLSGHPATTATLLSVNVLAVLLHHAEWEPFLPLLYFAVALFSASAVGSTSTILCCPDLLHPSLSGRGKNQKTEGGGREPGVLSDCCCSHRSRGNTSCVWELRRPMLTLWESRVAFGPPVGQPRNKRCRVIWFSNNSDVKICNFK